MADPKHRQLAARLAELRQAPAVQELQLLPDRCPRCGGGLDEPELRHYCPDAWHRHQFQIEE